MRKVAQTEVFRGVEEWTEVEWREESEESEGPPGPLAAGGPAGSVRVIGAGLGGTGTRSLKAALEELGLKTFDTGDAIPHLSNFTEYIRHLKIATSSAGGIDDLMREIQRASPGVTHKKLKDTARRLATQHAFAWSSCSADKRRPSSVREASCISFNLGNVFDANDFRATVAFPVCAIWEVLLTRAGNEGKVILSVRSSPEVWAKSFTNTIGRVSPLLRREPFRWSAKAREAAQVMDWMEAEVGIAAARRKDGSLKQEVLAQAYQDWNEQVVQKVPPEQLLIHRSSDGWPPLCDFLEVPHDRCPTTPFPHHHDGRIMSAVLMSQEIVARLFEAPKLLSLGIPLLCFCWIILRFVPSDNARARTRTPSTHGHSPHSHSHSRGAQQRSNDRPRRAAQLDVSVSVSERAELRRRLAASSSSRRRGQVAASS